MTNDGGGAPCIERGLLSLAICKPRIRVGAEPGNWILGYTANSLDPSNRLIYIAKVTGKARDGEYFRDEKYVNRRDSIYRMEAGRFRWKKGALYHSDADVPHDLGSPPHYQKAQVLLSKDFRYFGANGTADYKDRYPKVKAAFEALGRGHRVHHDEPLLHELQLLIAEEWAKTSRKVLGRPTSEPTRNACYRGVSSALAMGNRPEC